MGSGACAASGASNASAAEATSLYGAATRRAAGVSLLRAARRGGPGGVPTTADVVQTVRTRPDASELKNCVKKRVFRAIDGSFPRERGPARAE